MFTQSLSFSQNWNGKLLLDVFGTVRMHNPGKYFIGNDLMLDYRGKELGAVKVEALITFRFDQINDRLSYIDTGKPAHYLAALLSKMYTNKGVVLPSTLFDHVIVRYTQRNLPNQELLLKDWWDSKMEQQPQPSQASFDFLSR